jgi:excisionase family DNA binding protein
MTPPPSKTAAKPAADERLLTLRELADFLQINERTLLKLAGQGRVPGAQIGNEWRFKREVIDSWLEERMGEIGPGVEPLDVPDGGEIPLSDLLEERGIVTDLKAKDRVQAIEALAQRAFANGWVADKPWFVGALVERESLSSTAMPGGIAFLHTRQRHSRKITRPFIVFGRSYSGVDFGAEDGKPTHLFFLLGLKYDRLHLPVLGRLAKVLRTPELVARLRAAPTPTRIRDTLLGEDRRATPPVTAKTK